MADNHGHNAQPLGSNSSWSYDSDLGGYNYTSNGSVPVSPWVLSQTVMKLQHFVRILHMHYVPILVTVGLLGNFLSCAVLCFNRLRKISACHYLIGKLLSDVCFLLTLLHQWLTELNIFFYSLGGWCQFTTFLRHASGFLSLWYTFCFVVDVFIRVQFPGMTATLCTPWRAKVVIIALAVVAMVVFLNISLVMGVAYADQRPYCGHLPQFANTIRNLDHADVIINVLIPYLFMITMVFMVAVRLLRPTKESPGLRVSANRQPLTNSGRRTGSNTTTEILNPRKTLGSVFLTLLISYLLLNLPLQGLRVYFVLRDMTSPQESTLVDFLWKEIFQFVYFTNMSICLVVLLVSFGRFRKEIRRLFRRLVSRSCCQRSTNRAPMKRNDTASHHVVQHPESGNSCIEV